MLPNNMWALNNRNSGNSINNPALTSGIYGFAKKQPYRNGSPESNLIPSTTPIVMQQLLIGAANGSSTSTPSPFYYFTGDIQALAIDNTIWSSDKVTSLYTAMAAL